MKNRVKKIIALALSIVTVGALFTGCGKSEAASKQTQTTETAATQAKTKVIVATGGQPKPFTYKNESDELVGYDIEVVKAIFEKLPQYELDFEVTDFTSIFAGLDSDRYQIGANNFALNKERQEKYIYTNPIFKNAYVIAVAEDNKEIQSFEDLLGKTTEISAGTNYATALENYNKENADNPVKISYSEADLLPVLQHVEGGQYDFQLIDKSMLQEYIKGYGLKVKYIELDEKDTERIATPYSYLLVSKGNEQLEKDINGALAELIQNRKIKEISETYFSGEDYTPEVQNGE